MTYGTLISSVTVGAGGATAIDFTSIPQTYTDLILVWSSRDNNAAIYHDLLLKFNNNTTGYFENMLYAVPANVYSYANNNGGYGWMTNAGAGATANSFSNGQMYVANYAGSANKGWSSEVVTENNATGSWLALDAGKWANTSAITSLNITSIGGATIQQYSSFYLYGLTKGSGGATVS